MMITLIAAGLGTWTEPGQDVLWIRDRYTEPREADFECCECELPIDEWEFWTCMDGGETAHERCVRTMGERDLDLLLSYKDGQRIWDAASVFARVHELHMMRLIEPVPDSAAYRLTEAGREVVRRASTIEGSGGEV